MHRLTNTVSIMDAAVLKYKVIRIYCNLILISLGFGLFHLVLLDGESAFTKTTALHQTGTRRWPTRCSQNTWLPFLVWPSLKVFFLKNQTVPGWCRKILLSDITKESPHQGCFLIPFWESEVATLSGVFPQLLNCCYGESCTNPL